MKQHFYLLSILISALFTERATAQNILINQAASVSVAGGELFYDAGGAAGNDGNTNYTMTLTPATSGDRVCLDFSYFKTTFTTNIFGSNDEDALFIYDGTTATGNDIGKLMGDYTAKTSSSSVPIRVGMAASATSAAVFRPTMFCATNSTGALTVKFNNTSTSQQPGWIADVITYTPADNVGCDITLTADQTSICAGQTVNLTATGALVSAAINNDFNNSTVGTGWASTASASFTNSVCAAPSLDGSIYLWMQSQAAPRQLKTNAMDVTNGGTLSFEYRQATYNSDASPCESPDIGSGTTNEGVYVQYSTDGGTSWITMKYLFSHSLLSNSGTADSYNNGCGDYVTRWTKMTYPIPTAAQTATTQFRWIQPAATSASTDNWGLDNVIIASPLATTITIRDLTAGGTIVGTSTTSPYSIPVTPTVTTTYEVTISDGVSSCTDQVIVTVNPSPTASISGSQTICNGSSANLSVAFTGAAPWDFTYSDGSTSTNVTGVNSSPYSLPVSPASTKTYTITAVSNAACSGTFSGSAVVTVTALPVLVITNPTAVCSPATVDITAAGVTAGSTGGGTLTYWTNAGASVSLATPAAVATSGTYYIKSAVGTCTDIEAVTVTINTTPVLSITNPTAVCSPNTVNLTAAGVTAGSTGGGTLSYWTNAGASSSLGSPTAVASSGTYYIQSALGACVDIEAVTVTINTSPTLTINSPGAVCSPLTVDITAASVTTGSTGGGTLSYWTNVGASIALGTPNAVASYGTYYIQSTLGSCTDIEAVTVLINNCSCPIDLAITNPVAVCAPGTVDITASAVTAGSIGGGALTYWTDAACTIPLSTPTAVSSPGAYYIKSDNGSCSDIDYVTVSISTTPSLTITHPAAVCSPLTVDITNSAVTAGSMGGGTLSYWNDGAASSALATPSAVNVSGTYYIQSTLGSCTDIEAVTVLITPTPVLTITDPAAACPPATVDLTSSAITAGSTGGGTLTYWTDVAATAPLASPAAVSVSGSYFIKASNGTCTDIASVTVTLSAPVLSITSPTAVCAPSTIDITAPAVTVGSTGGGVLSYWTDVAATAPLASPAAVGTSGTYYIKVTSGACSDVEAVTVTVNTTPVLSITDPTAVCEPSTVDLTAASITVGSTGGGTLSYWTDAAATLAVGTPTAVSTSGMYYIKALLGSCSDIEAVNVTISTAPVLAINNPLPVCSPATIDLTAAGVTTGSSGGGILSYWSDAAGTVALGSPSAVATSGTYYIRSSIGSCSDIASVVVQINTTPVLSITSPAAVCAPTTVDLTAATVTAGSTGGGTLTYWTNAGASVAMTSPAAVASSGTYYIQSTAGFCSDLASVIVTITNTPVLTVSSPAAVCSPLTVDLTAGAITAGSTGGGTLSYWTNAGASIALGSPSAVSTSGIYYIQSSNGSCSDIEAVTVTINTTPVLAISNPAVVCAPLMVDLTANAVTNGSTGAGTLSYWNDAAASSAVSNPQAIASSGTFYILSTVGSCTDIAAVNVVINASPVLQITDPSAVCSPLTVDITQAAITAGSTGSGVLSYWADAGASSSLGNPTSLSTGSYYIQSTLGTCSDIALVNVTVNSAPTLAITDPAAICAPETIDITSSEITNGSTNGTIFSYWLDASATLPLANPSAISSSGDYFIEGTNGGCSSVSTVVVTIHPQPTALFYPKTAAVSNLVPSTTMINNSSNAVNYWWDFGDFTSSEEIAPAHTFPAEDTGTFYITLVAYSEFGCTDTAYHRVNVFEELIYYIPNSFTPDGDKFNNVFKPQFTTGYNPDSYNLLIYNRWGQMIFESTDTANGWDGTFASGAESAQDGTYTWVINFTVKSGTKRERISGHVNLLR